MDYSQKILVTFWLGSYPIAFVSHLFSLVNGNRHISLWTNTSTTRVKLQKLFILFLEKYIFTNKATSYSLLRYTHAHQVPHAEHMESLKWRSSKCWRDDAVLSPPIRSRVSEWSKSLGWRCASRFSSPLPCRLSSFCWVVNRLPYIWTHSGIVFYLPSPRPRSPSHRVMASWVACAKRYVNSIYFNRKPVTDRHTSTTSD